jgi:hypothetical protein
VARIIKALAIYILSNRLFSKPYGDLSDAPVLAGRVLLEQSLIVFFLGDIIQYYADVVSALSHLLLSVLAMLLHRCAPGLSPLQDFFCQENARCRNLAWLPFVHF